MIIKTYKQFNYYIFRNEVFFIMQEINFTAKAVIRGHNSITITIPKDIVNHCKINATDLLQCSIKKIPKK